jgi:anti-anti-sigma factor
MGAHSQKMSLQIYTSSRDQETVLSCHGQIVRGDSTSRLYGAIALHRTPSIALDLSNVDKIDGAGLGILIISHLCLQSVDQRLVLRGVQPRVLEIIELTGLHRVLNIAGPNTGASARGSAA